MSPCSSPPSQESPCPPAHLSPFPSRFPRSGPGVTMALCPSVPIPSQVSPFRARSSHVPLSICPRSQPGVPMPLSPPGQGVFMPRELIPPRACYTHTRACARCCGRQGHTRVCVSCTRVRVCISYTCVCVSLAHACVSVRVLHACVPCPVSVTGWCAAAHGHRARVCPAVCLPAGLLHTRVHTWVFTHSCASAVAHRAPGAHACVWGSTAACGTRVCVCVCAPWPVTLPHTRVYHRTLTPFHTHSPRGLFKAPLGSAPSLGPAPLGEGPRAGLFLAPGAVT